MRPVWKSAWCMLLAPLITSCAPAAVDTPRPASVEEEARHFMAGYAADLLSHDPDAIAARYSRRGAYVVLPGSRALVPYDSILSEYRAAAGQGPDVFEWQGLSYDVLNDDIVAVVGTFHWESVERRVLGSYTSLLVREDGELRIRLENESFDDLPPPECAAQEEPCDLPLERAALERYTGAYEVAGQEDSARVYEQDGGLMFQPPGLPPMRLLYRGGDEFRVAGHLAVRVVFDGPGARATSYIVLRGMVLDTGKRIAVPSDLGGRELAMSQTALRDTIQRVAAPAQVQGGWRTATPAEVGMDPARLEELTRSLRRGEHGNVHAVLIEKDGRLVYEEYFTGPDEMLGTPLGSLGRVTFGPASLHDLRSVSKGVISTLIGIAIGGGDIPSVEARLRDLLPEYAAFLDGEKAELRLRHVLSMSAGLEWDEWSHHHADPQNDRQRLIRAADPVALVLGRDLVHEPGSTFTYSGGLTHLLAVILERATGEQFDDYAHRVLFEPLGIHEVVWLGQIGGIPAADGGLRMRGRDLAKIGSLYLNGGRWHGRQIVPEAWVAEAPIRRVIFSPPGPRPDFALEVGYGYQWYSTRFATSHGEVDVQIMLGNGQQRVMVVPELSLAVTMFAGHYYDPSAEIRWMPDRLLVEYVVNSLIP
jgi:CubicO group peptidase (beta-lactamase class C family)